MTRGIQALMWILVVSIVLVGCISKSGDESVIQPSESKNKVSMEEAKKLVLESEEWLKRIKEHGIGERIGDFGVSPIYGLEDPSRDNLETELLKYFSKDIHKYVLATHEIFCTAELCGVYGDSEGQYQVDVDGNFSIKEQTEAYIDLNIPFIYEGLPSDYQDLSPSFGVYRISKNQGDLLIVKISQDYNDQLYNYEDDLLVESVQQTHSYSNGRYGYGIDYPSNWSIGEESPSGDGVVLFNENGNDIRVYARYLLGDPTDQMEIDEAESKGWAIEEFTLSTGEVGQVIIAKNNDKQLMHFIVNNDSIQCHLYAEMMDEYYLDNVEVLQGMARSISLD